MRALIGMMVMVLILCEDPQLQKTMQVQQKQIEARQSAGLKYDDNTQILTFSLTQMSDFLLKPQSDEEVKATIHTYWQQQNIYISSQYKEGEHIQLVIYENNERIIENINFYVTHGFKFNAKKNNNYLIRFVSYGKISKLIAFQITQSIPIIQNLVELEHVSQFENRVAAIGKEMKALLAIEQRNIILEEKANFSMNHSTCIYMSYMIGQAILILLLVGIEVKFMKQLLSSESVV